MGRLFDNIRVLLFDLDGTLIDSARDLYLSINHALQEHHLPARSFEEINSFIGDGVYKLVERSTGSQDCSLNHECLDCFLQHYRDNCLACTRLYPEVRRTLPKLTMKKIIVTNKSHDLAVRIIEGLGVAPHFSEIIGGDTLSAGKPSPVIIDHIADKMAVKREHMAIVGDHATDIQLGLNADVRTVFCEYGIGARRGLEPTASIGHFGQLLDLFT